MWDTLGQVELDVAEVNSQVRKGRHVRQIIKEELWAVVEATGHSLPDVNSGLENLTGTDRVYFSVSLVTNDEGDKVYRAMLHGNTAAG
jgi:hypothetical protein